MAWIGRTSGDKLSTCICSQTYPSQSRKWSCPSSRCHNLICGIDSFTSSTDSVTSGVEEAEKSPSEKQEESNHHIFDDLDSEGRDNGPDSIVNSEDVSGFFDAVDDAAVTHYIASALGAVNSVPSIQVLVPSENRPLCF